MSGGPSLEKCLDVVIDYLRYRIRLIDVAIANLEQLEESRRKRTEVQQ